MLQGDEGAVERARKLRREMSLPERLLWSRLRRKPDGIKFRNQHPGPSYIADFYCHEHRLIIEIDGISHDMGNRPFKDEQRDAWFRERNLEVIRIPARDVLADPDAVAQSIVSYCAANAADRTH
jgi:very-short-patch-repair endonuclease